ncbi:unnamed protein product [Notodromas monacha]|uniref:Histidine decarboxylase n=1 Tax=Notodromas monacha TaxID=399045 RepID=A0A7R9GFB5_9CRUS|nr:unnamed protein product [Notodromas monacha]CAG0919177.1 unnamed protein product [Notodromas monacha]
MRGDQLMETINKDKEKGLIPFYVCATLGTTGACAFDNLKEIGPICEKESIWLHVDAAYAGASFICPEFRGFCDGIQHANSFAFNPSKNLLHWQMQMSRRFRSLKLWFVIRNYGIGGLQKHIRHGNNEITEQLLKTINDSGQLHCVPCLIKGKYAIRFAEMVDYIADYLENIREKRVFPDVKPGYLRNLVPDCAPQEAEPWTQIFDDVENFIVPGLTHWQSPHMHGYFPALNSPASILGDMLSGGFNCIGFTWAASPACTELETLVMDWLGKMLNLPEDFLHTKATSLGGGVIQTTMSEATFVTILAARKEAVRKFKMTFPSLEESEINSRLVAYCPFFCGKSVAHVTCQTQTGEKESIWLHVDAAYAGASFICPEFRGFCDGIQHANSFAFNPSKNLLVTFDCTAMWVKNCGALHRTFNVEPLYLQHENTGLAIDYMHWQIQLSRRFRSLKLWFVIRNYGIQGLQAHIRHGVSLAARFEQHVKRDLRFEIPAQRHLGLVVFRLKGENELTEMLLKRVNASGQLHCVPCSIKGKYVIRFTVTSPQTTEEDIARDWGIIQTYAEEILRAVNTVSTEKQRVILAETRRKNANFGTSLLLANIVGQNPSSPKVVNGSFAAIFDSNDVLFEFAKQLSQMKLNIRDSPAVKRRIRSMVVGGKQYSLDSRMDLVSSVSDHLPTEEEMTANASSVANSNPSAPTAAPRRAIGPPSRRLFKPKPSPLTLESPMEENVEFYAEPREFLADISDSLTEGSEEETVEPKLPRGRSFSLGDTVKIEDPWEKLNTGGKSADSVHQRENGQKSANSCSSNKSNPVPPVPPRSPKVKPRRQQHQLIDD